MIIHVVVVKLCVESFRIHCWIIILLLVCLIIADLLYVYTSTMFKFIEEMLLNFSNNFSSTVVCENPELHPHQVGFMMDFGCPRILTSSSSVHGFQDRF
jgi:hypothetical protein